MSAASPRPLTHAALVAAPYDRRPELDPAERRALGALAVRRQYQWPKGIRPALARLLDPIEDALAVIAPRGGWTHSPTRGAVFAAMEREGMAFWGFGRERWRAVVASTPADVRQLVMAIAYLHCDERELHRHFPGVKRRLFCQRVLGREAVDCELDRLRAYLDGFGYAARLGRPPLLWGLFELMLAAASPRLEDIAREPQTFVELRARGTSPALRHGVSQLAAALCGMGLMADSPFAGPPTDAEWLARAGAEGVPEEWAEWIGRWYCTSTLSLRTRQGCYYTLAKAGRWLAACEPGKPHPASWRRQTAAAWVAGVERMEMGDFSRAPNTDAFRKRSGSTLRATTKASHIITLRTFFCDLQEWEWIERRFNPHRAFAIPRSTTALIGPDPRVIASEIWAKLVWAGLNLEPDDLPGHVTTTGSDSWYPLELVRAIAALWLFAGLRSAEIMRLRAGCIRWQRPDAEAGSEAAVCLLDVPVHKTGTAFTKPVDPIVGEAIEHWQERRPTQPAMVDPKTGEAVQILFAYRGARLGSKYINQSLIPLLCRKAGVPREDVRGSITSHRARATIASQLYNAKDPMSLVELQAWLGHRSPNSTQHYARLTPTTLARAYTDAGYFARNVRTIEVLLDREAIGSGAAEAGEPFEYFDLGHGYCTYSFFEQCPHRMACARCDFYLPKDSSRAQLVEAKANLQRMLVEIPLTDEERAAVEDGETAVGRLIERLADVATPAGPTPRALDQATSTGTALPVLGADGRPQRSGGPGDADR